MWWPGAVDAAQAVTDLKYRPMELRYKFDPEKWCLGTLCIHGHKFPGTELSLRRNYKRANRCAACCAGDQSYPWLLKFVDNEASGVPDGFRLGNLCKNGHRWHGTAYSLRNKGGHCVECGDSYRDPEKRRASGRASYQRHRERRIEAAKECYRRRVESGEQQAYLERSRADRIEYKRRKRAEAGATPQKLVALHAAIRSCGRSPSVARLVMGEQRRRWRECPEEWYLHHRWWRSYIYAWRYKCDPAFRRYQCQRTSEKKARNRGNHTVRLSRHQTTARFAEFSNRCAYCGSADQLIVEHFIPRSKGGPHAIGNILPACHRCNTSKTDHDPENWYRSRPYFSETRWRKILTALGKRRVPVSQLPLL
jgi:5-methylcytosine-specific restriction endonuclease McrA